jgi:hypothetical protein
MTGYRDHSSRHAVRHEHGVKRGCAEGLPPIRYQAEHRLDEPKKGGRQLRCINDLLSVIERPYLSPGNLELNLEKKCFSFFCGLERTISSGLA